MKKRVGNKLQKKSAKEYFEPLYFLLSKGNEQIYLKWETVEGVISDAARNNPETITYLMAQDIWGIYSRDYDTTVISEDEYKNGKS